MQYLGSSLVLTSSDIMLIQATEPSGSMAKTESAIGRRYYIHGDFREKKTITFLILCV